MNLHVVIVTFPDGTPEVYGPYPTYAEAKSAALVLHRAHEGREQFTPDEEVPTAIEVVMLRSI